MHDQGVEGRAPLDGEDTGDGVIVRRIRPEAVNGFCRKSNKLSLLQASASSQKGEGRNGHDLHSRPCSRLQGFDATGTHAKLKALRGERTMIITIAQQKGGAGKTTLAAQLATVFLSMNKTVATIDTDPAGLSHPVGECRREQLGDEDALMHVQAAGWRMERQARDLAEKYNYVLIDSPPHAEAEARLVHPDCKYQFSCRPSPHRWTCGRRKPRWRWRRPKTCR